MEPEFVDLSLQLRGPRPRTFQPPTPGGIAMKNIFVVATIHPGHREVSGAAAPGATHETSQRGVSPVIELLGGFLDLRPRFQLDLGIVSQGIGCRRAGDTGRLRHLRQGWQLRRYLIHDSWGKILMRIRLPHGTSVKSLSYTSRGQILLRADIVFCVFRQDL